MKDDMDEQELAQFLTDCESAEKSRSDRLYDALAKMFVWQAEFVNEVMPDDLGAEVEALLGSKMVDAICFSDPGESYETIAARISKADGGA